MLGVAEFPHVVDRSGSTSKIEQPTWPGHASALPALGDRFGVSWHGRSVLVIGLAKSGVAAAKWLQRMGCRVRVTELLDHAVLHTLATQLRESGIEHIELGHHTAKLCEDAEIVVVSPGVPESALPIRWAQERGIPIISEVELAFRFCVAPIVAVTGTNGKSSVVTLIQRVLRAAGRPAVACGNLGIPFSEMLPTLVPNAIAVVEVSSFQLLWCDQFRPTISVLLNVGTNHLDRHRDRDQYVAAKARLFQRQTPEDYAVLNGRDAEVLKLSQHLHAQRVWFGIAENHHTHFPLSPFTCQALSENAQAVLQVGRILGVPDPLIYQVIREFEGLEHRLEYVTTTGGVRVVNDSKSTTPESFLYALDRCPGPVVPIIGGRDKGLDFGPLGVALAQERIRGVVLIGESRQRLRALVNGSAIVRECETLDDAVQEAMELAHPGDTVLFSPSCASFDMFRNFEERGRIFKQLVHQWQRPVSRNGSSPAPSSHGARTHGSGV